MLSQATSTLQRKSARIVDDAIRRLPEEVMGHGNVATIATRTCTEEMLTAIATGQGHRVANAVRSLSQTPSHEQLVAIVDAVCDAIAGSAYLQSADVREISAGVNAARTIAQQTLDAVRRQSAVSATVSSDVEALVSGLMRMAGSLAPDRFEHLTATGELATRLALHLGLDARITANTQLAAKLHDIADIASVGANAHARKGAEILAGIPMLRHLAPIVRAHHERFDGAGLPDGLRGAGIPIESRIIAVADAFHDRTTSHTDEPPIDAVEALHQIEALAGSEFDPAVVAAAGSLLRINQHRRARSA